MAASIEAEQRNYSYRDVKKQVNANGIEFHCITSHDRHVFAAGAET
jgi:hypothetical protein